MKTHTMKGLMRIITGGVAFSASMVLLLMLLSCASGPDEATQQALNDAQRKMETARKQAMDFAGATYAVDEWNTAESLYTAVQDVPLVTMKDYQAAIPQVEDASNSYTAAFNKAAPLYVDARKNIIATVRQKAVDAGAETHLMLDMSAVDEQDRNALTLFANGDHYGYQTASFEVEKRYGVLAAEAVALSLKDEIIANTFDRFDPDAFTSADESMTAAMTAYTANDLDTAQRAADEAVDTYQQVLTNGWKSYADEQQQLAEAARTDAIAIHADIALKDDFNAAEAVYDQGSAEYGEEKYQSAADSFKNVQPLFAALTAQAGNLQKNAATALQAAQKAVTASQSKTRGLPEAANNEFLTKANELLTEAQSALDTGDYDGAIAAAAEAQKNAGLSDTYIVQQQKKKAANDALTKAKQQMDGVTTDVRKKYATLYNTATAAYADALNAQKAQNWDTVTADAKKINDTVLAIARAKASDDAAEKKAADAASAALAAAKKRLDGVSADNQKQFADQYRGASTAYTAAAAAQGAKDWGAVTAQVKRVNDALDLLDKAATAALAAEKKAADAASAALVAAKKRLDGVSADNRKQFADQYRGASTAYTAAAAAQGAKDWGAVTAQVKRVNDALDLLDKAATAALAAEKKAADAASAALAAAKKRLDGVSADNQKQFADQYRGASTAYTAAAAAQGAKDWGAVTTQVKRVNDALDLLDKAATAALAAEKKAADTAVAALAAAKKRLDGVSADNQKQFADQYRGASTAYTAAAAAQGAKDWNTVTTQVKRVNDALDLLDKAATAALVAAEERRKADEAARLAAEKKAADAASTALAAAKKRLDGVSADNQKQFADQYRGASTAYTAAAAAQGAKDWGAVTAQVKRVNDALDLLDKAAAAALAAAEERRKADEAARLAAEKKAADTAAAALAAAKKRLDGVSADNRKQFADQYRGASTAYTAAAAAQGAKDWGAVTAQVKRVNDALDLLDKAATAALVAAEERRKADEAARLAAEKKAADAASAALAAAKKRLDGVSADNRKQFADQYRGASTAYTAAAAAQGAKDWGAVTAQVKRVNDALDLLDKAAAAALVAAEERRKADEAARLAAERQQAEAEAAALAAAEEQRKADEAARLAAERQQTGAAAALAAAKDRLDWAASIGAPVQYPDPYQQAAAAYNEGEAALADQDWDKAAADAHTVVSLVDDIEAQKSGEANDAVSIAKERLDWAEGVNAAENYPDNFDQALGSYTTAVSALAARDWNAAIIAADGVMNALASVTGQPKLVPFPAQYIVRSWNNVRDCLWNIAGYPWVYNDPFQWRRLYEANRDKLPDPNNVEIGTVLDIPSIRGEVREGVWDESKAYAPLSLE